MNCSYFAMERRRTLTVNKKIKQIKQKNKIKYKKKNIKTKKQQTGRQTKTKQKENIQTSERGIHYTRSMKYSKNLIQWEKFTPLSATKEHLSYQHWKSEKNLIYVHFKCWLGLIPFSQYSPSNPGGHKHRYPLSVNPDWQVALFSQ